MPTTEFFKNLQANQSKQSKKSGNDHKQISIKENDVFELVRQFAKKKEIFDKVKADIDLLKVDINKQVIDKYEDLYCKSKENPGTLDVSFTNSKGEKASLMFIPTDGYKKIDNEDHANRLRKQFGDVIEETHVLTIEEAMFKKYEKVLAKFITTNPEIEDGDREHLMKFSTQYAVKKGSCNKLIDLAKKVKSKFYDVIDTIGMTVMLKNPRVEVEIPVVTATTKEKKTSVKA